MKKSVVIVSCLMLFLTIGAIAQPKVVVTDMPRSVNDGLNNLADQIAQGLTENQKRRIAVVEFVDLKGNVSDFGRFLAERLITRLFQSKKFTVIERQQLNKIISEQKLSLTGIIDPSSAQKLGRLLGVDSVATGSVTDLGKTVEVNARLISTETGEVFSAASVGITKDDSVCNLMGGCNPNLALNPQQETKPEPKPSPTPSSYPTVEANFFTFRLERCRLSGNSVICDLTVTNSDRDREMELYGAGGNSIFDDFNNSMKGAGAELANTGGKGSAGAKAFLVSGVATRARVYFEGFSPNATKITLLKIGFRTDREFSIQFRNISLR